jgi:uncharacterized repeat protein (TIGR03837 family)
MPTSTSAEASPGLRWDIFCRVVDNLGDAAICWRLARQLANEYSLAVRLWIDQPQALSRLVPGTRPGQMQDRVSIEYWRDDDSRLTLTEPEQLADVVIAGFACELPAGYRHCMTLRRPVWINLDYLSAQDWVDSHHGLPSPKADGLTEYFFFPGFTPESGGLLCEADLIDRCERFDRNPSARFDFLRSIGIDAEPGERFMSLFCYSDSPVADLIDGLTAIEGRVPAATVMAGKTVMPVSWRLLIPEGIAPELSVRCGVRRVPFLSQTDYDQLLWSCDLNWVRGEDSLVRALWSGRPLIWQAYRQSGEAHRPKLEAFLNRWLKIAKLPEPAATAWRKAHTAWNTAPDPASRALITAALPSTLEQLPALAAGARRWRTAQIEQSDLAGRLVAFAAGKL